MYRLNTRNLVYFASKNDKRKSKSEERLTDKKIHLVPVKSRF